ncbi:MAG: SusD/RagB family nutrient-binding outer membrane lipoprotein [Bacteroidales bacterium]|nr:SusD/RagB family nutrient-binding outer membrane lipoprotein [Bacteroidales bacterium]
MNNIIRYFVLAAAFAAGVACTGNYLNINSNPYGVTDDEMQRDGYAVRAALMGMANGVISPDVNTTQFTECLLGGTMGGYLADANNGWANTISNYNPTDNWTNVLMKSDRIIPVVYSNYRQLHQVTDDPVLYAVADIIKVTAMHRVTDTYGPMPYSKIGQHGEINVQYDSQEEVYTRMFEELDNAIDVLMPNRSNNFSASADVIYGGNVEKWIKFANSLKLRLAMRISYANPELSRKMAESAVRHEVGVIRNNEDNAMFSSWGTDGNPIDKSVEYNMLSKHKDTEETPCTTEGGDSHVAADIICYMNGYNDPRREKYFTPSEFSAEDGISDMYVGLRRCISIPNHTDLGHKFSGVKIGPSDAANWMVAAEVAFLEAEAVAVFGYDMGTSAAEAYSRGIQLSFAQWGVSGADSYMETISQPASYSAPGIESGATGSTITVKWDDAASVEEKQERIITQKWIANWLLGNEAWADWRRTGYPRLLPGTDTGNKSGGKVDNKTGARRMKYPTDEISSNAVYYQDAVTNLLNKENTLNTKSGDEMATRLWFDCKQNNPTYQN